MARCVIVGAFLSMPSHPCKRDGAVAGILAPNTGMAQGHFDESCCTASDQRFLRNSAGKSVPGPRFEVSEINIDLVVGVFPESPAVSFRTQ
jgi:hypothetical protein